MKTIKKIKGRITHSLNETTSYKKEGQTYFVIKVKGEDGVNYDVLPSSDTEEYEAWKEIARTGIGQWFEGFQYGGQGKHGPYFNKHILPHKLEEEKTITNTLL